GEAALKPHWRWNLDTRTSLPRETSVCVTMVKESVLPLTSPAKTMDSPTSLVLGRTTQSLGMMSSALPESTSREITHSEQRTSPSLSPQANGTCSRNSFAKNTFSKDQFHRRNFFQGFIYGPTTIVETTDGTVTDRYTAPTETSVVEGGRTGSTRDTKHLPAAIPALMETYKNLAVSKENVPMSLILSETTADDSNAQGSMNPLFGTISSFLLESLPRGLKSSALALCDEVSGTNTFSVHRVTTSVTTGTPENTEGTEPNSAVSFSMTLNNAATSADRVRSTTSLLAHPSPSGEGTARSILTLSTSSAGALASKGPRSPGNFNFTSVSGVKTTSLSTTLASEDSNTHLSMAEKESKETLNASVAAAEISAPGREITLAATLAPTSGFTTPENRVISATQVSSSHPVWELRTMHSTSAGTAPAQMPMGTLTSPGHPFPAPQQQHHGALQALFNTSLDSSTHNGQVQVLEWKENPSVDCWASLCHPFHLAGKSLGLPHSLGNPDSTEGTSWVLTPSNAGHPFSPEPGSTGDVMISTSIAMLSSASALGDSVRVQHILRGSPPPQPQGPLSPQKEQSPNQLSFSMTLNNSATSAERFRSLYIYIRGRESAHLVPPLTLSIPKARTLASEWSSGPGTLSLVSVSGMKTTFSPSTPSTSVETNTHLFIAGNESKETVNPSVSQPETSASRVKTTLPITSALTQGFPIMDTWTAHSALRATGSASVINSTSTALPKTSHPSRTSAFASAAAMSQTNTGTFNYSTIPQTTTWPETSPKFEISFTIPLPATLVVLRFTSPTTSSVERTSLGEPSTATLTTETMSGLATVHSTVSTNIKTTGCYGSERRLGTTHLPVRTTSPSETSTDFTLAKESKQLAQHFSSSLSAPAARITITTTFSTQRVTTSMIMDTAKTSKWNMSNLTFLDFLITRKGKAPLFLWVLHLRPINGVVRGRVVTLVSTLNQQKHPACLRAHASSDSHSSTTLTTASLVKTSSYIPLSFPSVETTSPWYLGSTTYITTTDPKVISSAKVSSSCPVKEFRTSNSYPRTESTSPATHPGSPKIPRTPDPSSPATSTPRPVSVLASTSPTNESSTSELTSVAPGEPLALTTSEQNTVTSWLWAIIMSLPMAAWLSTSLTEEMVSTDPDVSSPSSSETTFATFSPVSLPPRELSNSGIDGSALQNTDSATLGQHLEGLRCLGTTGDLTPLPATASQQLTVGPEPSPSISLIYSSSDTTAIGVTDSRTRGSPDVPESRFLGFPSTGARKFISTRSLYSSICRAHIASSTDVTVVSTTKFPVYESSSWLKSDPLTPMTVVDSVEQTEKSGLPLSAFPEDIGTMGTTHAETSISLTTLDWTEGSRPMSSSICITTPVLESTSETYIGTEEETIKDASTTLRPQILAKK
ncbi:hypothetical protein HPG69_014728, partial [Diceros bicornis minor]